jgi:FtsP/CotA-like multicopper oxidase with cupredoxin domain
LINFINKTLFTTNVHYHGLDDTGNIDGASSLEIFGHNTSLGNNVNFQFPTIKNNSSLLWYHAHPPYRSVELAYAGIVGPLLITDNISQPLYNYFTYGENYFLFYCLDMDFDSNGIQVFKNLGTFVNRSSFTVINGISCVQWYEKSSSTDIRYSNILKQSVNSNIVKFDILNPNGNWRVLYLGVCDISKKDPLPFYVIQSDQGLAQPVKTKIQRIPVGGRISILVDLTEIESLYLFFYDYDLSEIVSSNPDGTFVCPNFNIESSTPYPSPIPDPNSENQQSNYTKLDYPLVPLIGQINTTLTYGYCPIPETYFIRPFLLIKKESPIKEISLESIINTINNIIFKNGIAPFDEINYLQHLNPSYYYNLPDITPITPKRNFVMWAESEINYINGIPGNKYIENNNGSNIYGVTEYCSFVRRIYADLWNSEELDLNQALIAYSKSPNNYKPKILPSSNFRITQTQDQFINLTGVSNDNFTIDIFQDEISYNDSSSQPFFSCTIHLPSTPRRINLNIKQWVNLLNKSLKETNFKLNGKIYFLSNLLSFDWSFFPYGINLLDGTVKYIKSAIIKTRNHSNYYIRIKARWAFLQLIGKCMTGKVNLTPPTPLSGPCCSIDSPCDEFFLYGVNDNYIQSIYPYYATNNPSDKIGILCPRRNAELIILPQQTYIGLYDSYFNDNLDSFSVNLGYTEIWNYLNADYADSHPFHFHQSSGFSSPILDLNNLPNSVGSNLTPGFSQKYSRDIFQIGPQQSISFAIKWPNYPSEDTTNSPYIPNVGSLIHCHYLTHSDLSSMMISYSIKPKSNFISNICFPANTPIKTDQGEIPIEFIDTKFHTICNKKITDITKTISLENFLVCFEENAFGKGIPSKKTIISRKHKILYNGKMTEAETFLGKFDLVYEIKYNGEKLYNILMENYNVILVNNLVCETLHPENYLAKLHLSFKNKNSKEIENIIKNHNSCLLNQLSKNNNKINKEINMKYLK